MPDLISVIVTTYNREDALDAVLRTLVRQSDRGFETIVADDGSGEATAAVVERWRANCGMPLAHVRHEHCGYRVAEIRNRALLVARGDYCIFLDGDCLVRPDFVAGHRRLAERGWFVSGKYVQMSEALTEFSLRRNQEPELWSLVTWIGLRSYRAIDRWMPLVRLPLGPLRKRYPYQWMRANCANLGVWRSDIDRVDGFDGAFTGWGCEDADLLVRLLHAGVCCKDGRFAVPVLHLWHPPADRSAFEDNRERLTDTMRSRRFAAPRGLSALAGGARSLHDEAKSEDAR